MVMLDFEQVRLLNKVLYLYYIEEMTQSEIANRLGISTPKVNRLLQVARKQKMVEITISTPFQYLSQLESRLEAIFGIREAVVIPRIPENVSAMTLTLGRAGANYLLEHLRDGDVIAIGGGTTVHAVVQAVNTDREYNVEVVPVLGGVQGRVTTDVNYLAAQLAEKLGGRSYQLHTPAFVETPEHRDALLRMGPIKNILDIARKASIALLGIGALDPNTSRFVQFTALSASEMHQISKMYGGVGEILAIIYDAHGKPCAPEYSDRVVGLTLKELEQIPLRIGVAGTTYKALPIYGALRGGFFHTLITDEAAAQGVLDLFEKEFRYNGSSDKECNQGVS